MPPPLAPPPGEAGYGPYSLDLVSTALDPTCGGEGEGALACRRRACWLARGSAAARGREGTAAPPLALLLPPLACRASARVQGLRATAAEMKVSEGREPRWERERHGWEREE